MQSPFGESRGGTPMGERALQGASRMQVRRIRISVFRRSAFLFFFHVVAQRPDRDGAGPTAGVI